MIQKKKEISATDLTTASMSSMQYASLSSFHLVTSIQTEVFNSLTANQDNEVSHIPGDFSIKGTDLCITAMTGQFYQHSQSNLHLTRYHRNTSCNIHIISNRLQKELVDYLHCKVPQSKTSGIKPRVITITLDQMHAF